jgi:hypothetical protein
MTLAPPDELERRGRLVVLVETLLEPDFEFRYHEFYERWSKTERVIGVRTGEGDHAFLWFGKAGALVRGYLRGRPTVPPDQLFKGLPPALNVARDEEAFQYDGDSFALWWPRGAKQWKSAVSPVRGGAFELLFAFDGKASTFADWVADYYERTLDVKALTAVLKTGLVTGDFVNSLGDASAQAHAKKLAKRLGVELARPVPPAKGKAKAATKAATKLKAGAKPPAKVRTRR